MENISIENPFASLTDEQAKKLINCNRFEIITTFLTFDHGKRQRLREENKLLWELDPS